MKFFLEKIEEITTAAAYFLSLTLEMKYTSLLKPEFHVAVYYLLRKNASVLAIAEFEAKIKNFISHETETSPRKEVSKNLTYDYLAPYFNKNIQYIKDFQKIFLEKATPTQAEIDFFNKRNNWKSLFLQ